MQFVTKFINVIGSYYGEMGINSANSTGATDVIIVEQPDGSYKCTPFHVRFGKLNILRPKEVIVDLYLNNEFVKDLNMRVEPTGQAYFELENEDPEISRNQEKEALSIDITSCRNISGVSDIIKNESIVSPVSSTFFENDSFEHAVDPIDSGYRSSDEILFTDNKLTQMFDAFGDVKLSLCDGLENLTTGNAKSLDNFLSQIVTFEEFSQNPYEIINNQNLVILYDNNYMNWKTFSLIMIAQLAYNQKISRSFATDISNSKKKTPKSYRTWLRWGTMNEENINDRGKTSSDHVINTNEDHSLFYTSRIRTLSGDIPYSENKDDHQINIKLEDLDLKSNNNLISSNNIPSRSVDDSAIHFATHGIKKTNVLPHEKLKLLKLNEGVNELFYVITGKYRGTIKVGCKVYLWHYLDRIVVSDIDGTITKSDVWGQLAPWLGLDWTQSGIVKLYNSIQKNFFRFVYLSARAIGQADQTREYLQNVQQQDMFLPDGPLLLAPNSLFIAFKKEVIDKTPEEFKISCLNDLKSLYPSDENQNSLYAGFGNKPSDEITYKAVGIPESKIFTVNKKGELSNKALESSFSNSIKTYDSLTQLVNQYFPSEYTELKYFQEYSSFSFWRNGDFLKQN